MAMPWAVGVPSPLTTAYTESVQAYCIEAKTRLAASVSRARVVQVVISLLSLIFPSPALALGSEFHSVMMMGNAVPIVSAIAFLSLLMLTDHRLLCVMQVSVEHES